METAKMDMALQRRIFEVLSDQRSASGALSLCAKDIAEKLTVEKDIIDRALTVLQTFGLIKREGKDGFILNKSINFALSSLGGTASKIVQFISRQIQPVNAKTIAVHTDIPLVKVSKVLSELAKDKVICVEPGEGQEEWHHYRINADEVKPEPELTGIEKQVADLLSKGKPLDAAEIAKELQIGAGPAGSACYRLKKREIIDAIGKKPYHYCIKGQKPEETEELRTPVPMPTRVYDFLLKNAGTAFNSERIAQVLDVKKPQAATALFALKRRGQIKAKKGEGRGLDYYVSKKYVPRKKKADVPTKKIKTEQPILPSMNDVIDKVIEKENDKVEETFTDADPVLKEPVLFGDYVIMYALRRKGNPQKVTLRFLYLFKDDVDFQEQFEKLQRNPDLVEINAFKKMKKKKRVVYTPEI